ncbi:hypothetical protein BFS07_05445 [Clostridium perfringens]|uniref:Gp12 protein n=1 Tax=Clostridium perfringens (strain ATCC 13124 / DSM 756 / JCM 1290 / NCIMB 6125 / NCTC 8237 / Type A) TaxID=195103 RepID=A0A0H2YSE5_CLOP1|nr:hypothetical protein [Clostridium perfringens]YP_006383516.1 gp12 [Clostridium phage PhiS63]ABG83617.1 conserved hypothetical protein [Clostridium perfringens ATCC 13124]AFJ96070.1 gp12 [Clostridium phage PhiS63]EJT6167410.1 hypothetical protein [Clostridium perfringens]EJT6497569.1 hypothetical protein [Clostridium perfringens]EJT6620686.1 hypothetical protein [Clostridium perfringens]
MKIEINGTTYDSGKIVRKKYRTYTEAKAKINEKEEKKIDYTDDDLELMEDTIVTIYDNQFTKEDIDDNLDVAEIIFEFMKCDIEIVGKLDKNIDKAQKAFTKGKK